MDVLVCFCQNGLALYFHQSSAHPRTSVHIMHEAKPALLKLISESNFDLFSWQAGRQSVCFARMLIFAVWIYILAYGYLHIDLTKWINRWTGTDHRNTRTTTVMIFTLMIITTISTGQQGRRPNHRNKRTSRILPPRLDPWGRGGEVARYTFLLAISPSYYSFISYICPISCFILTLCIFTTFFIFLRLKGRLKDPILAPIVPYPMQPTKQGRLVRWNLFFTLISSYSENLFYPMQPTNK